PFALFVLAIGLTASAQPPSAPAPRSAAGAPIASVPPDGPGKADGKDAKVPGQTESPRMTRLKQLTFDRRPSSVLKACAPPDKDEKPAISKDPKEEALDKELTAFQKSVTLGNWPPVKSYLASLPDEEAVAAYRQLLANLQQRPMSRGGP